MRKRSTLMGYKKEYLVEQIESLEHNCKVLQQAIDAQYCNAMKIFEEMNVFNETYAKNKRMDL